MKRKPPILFITVGFPGSGKTVTSRIISDLTGAIHIWADQERLHKFKQPTHDFEESRQLYAELNERAINYLKDGKSVIFDSNFNFMKDRHKIRKSAEQVGAATYVIWVKTSVEESKRRAVLESENKFTRLFGNMPSDRFKRVSSNLQPPQPDEPVIIVDGMRISPEYLREILPQEVMER